VTRSERVRAACERFAEGPPDQESVETVDEGVEAALDAALADLGGLDGLAVLVNVAASDFATEKRLNAKLTADRDRLRDALRQVVERAGEHWGPLDLALDGAETALRESEAGT